MKNKTTYKLATRRYPSKVWTQANKTYYLVELAKLDSDDLAKTGTEVVITDSNGKIVHEAK